LPNESNPQPGTIFLRYILLLNFNYAYISHITSVFHFFTKILSLAIFPWCTNYKHTQNLVFLSLIIIIVVTFISLFMTPRTQSTLSKLIFHIWFDIYNIFNYYLLFYEGWNF